MKYIITENKLEKAIIHFLNKRYGDLKVYKTYKYPDSVFFVKNRKIYMDQDLENGDLFVDHTTIWLDLENLFSLEYDDIQSVIKKWVEEAYNIKGVTPKKSIDDILVWWKRLTI